MTEAELQAAVAELCKYRDLWHYHTHDSRRSNPGWVDLVIIGRKSLFVELKSENGRRSLVQVQVARILQQAGLEYRLWRPEHLHNGVILRELEAIR